ncbi:MAG: AMP-binding protein [Spirosomataceae bacterium]
MFFNSFLQNVRAFPHKVAIRYLEEELTYAVLAERVQKRALDYTDFSTRFWIISTDNPVIALVDWLALMYLGKVGILAPKEWRNAYFQFFTEQNEVQSCRDVPERFVEYSPQTPVEVTENDLFVGILSSGSTGQPKLIWKDYQSWLSAFPAQSEVFGLHESDVLYLVDALAYSANANAALHMLWCGGTLHFTPVKDLAKPLPGEVTSLFLVPSHARIWVQHQSTPQIQLTSFFTAGEKLESTLASQLLRLLPNATLTEYYGAAELGHIAYHQNQSLVENPHQVGSPFPGVEITLQGNQIYVQSPYISPDYRSIRTVGDLGVWENGALVLLGRQGRMFNRRGLNILAEEIEQIAWEMPGLQDVLAIQVKPGKIWLLYVANESRTSSQWRQLFHAKLPKAKCPTFFKQVPFIPRTLAGKVDFRAAARLYAASEEDSFDFQEES